MSKLFITGSTGHLGKATINFLLQKGVVANQISALARDEGKAAELKSKGIDVKIGNYDDIDYLRSAMQGIETMLLISSSEMNKSRAEQHINAIKVAKENGVKHIVYTSFMRTEEDPKSPLWFIAEDHIETEKYLKESGITFTLFDNGFYLDMLMDYVGEQVLETKTIFVPAGKGKVNFVLRNEVAEALANVLTTSGHDNKTYLIGNEQPISFGEIANYISELTGVAINYVTPEPEVYKQTLMRHDVPEDFARMFTAFAVAFLADTMNISTTDLTQLLGRKPTTVKKYLSSKFKK
ncbi:SDR family oxidoreductase [Flavobacterium sp. CS20]|uniref:SDR family oxidoreductase n=1 Tax=Flavobacterium sp. CS20 TaxID=2775246 RepID=UPI001B3A2587|nr:SDR family oxidoreductase [Flavobacterium sp. CS20]QTY27932.1 SDR family oxidoreductase [Flavobacterium sp. CS20]